MTDFYQAERPIVKSITDFFKAKEFEKGYELLEKSQLSALDKLECLGNAEFYKRNFQNLPIITIKFYNKILNIVWQDTVTFVQENSLLKMSIKKP